MLNCGCNLLAILEMMLPNAKIKANIITIRFIELLIITCLWMFLNLIPIPGFDGFHILEGFIPHQFYKISDKNIWISISYF